MHQFLSIGNEAGMFFEIEIFVLIEPAEPLTDFGKYLIHVIQDFRGKRRSGDFKPMQKTHIILLVPVEGGARQLPVQTHELGIKSFDAPEIHQPHIAVLTYEEISRIGIRVNAFHPVQSENEKILQRLGHFRPFFGRGIGSNPLIKGHAVHILGGKNRIRTETRVGGGHHDPFHG